MGPGGRMSAFSWTLIVGSVGLAGTIEAVSIGAARGPSSAAVVYAATWLAVWLLAECRMQRLPAARAGR